MCKVLLTAKKGGQKATGNTCKAKKGGQSNQGEGKPMQLKWTEKKFRQKFTKSLKLLKGEYDDKSVNLFGENIIERLKLDEICAKSCTDETKEWIVRPDTRKPTYNAITHVPKLISQIVLKKPKEKFNRTWVKESLNPGSNHMSSGMINALENLVRIGILEDVDKSFKDRGFLYYRLSLDLFRGLKRKKGNENEKEKKIKVENQVVIDLTSDDSSDDFNDGNAGKQKHDNNEETTVTVHIGAATTSNAVVQLNQDCALNDSNDISAKKYENANVVEQPKMATPVNTTAATSSSAEPQLNLVQARIARAELDFESSQKQSKQKQSKQKKKKKKKKEEEKHPILRCEIPWDDLNSDLQVHLKTLNFSKRKWKDKTLPNIFDQNWDDIDDDARNAAAAFGCNKLSWNSKEPAFIFTNPKLCVLID